MPIGYFQGYVSSPASAYRCLTNWQKAPQHEKIPNKLRRRGSKVVTGPLIEMT
jgi:hypothetical protein